MTLLVFSASATPFSFAQGQASMGTVIGESYLDGFDLETILGLADVPHVEEKQALSYLDEVAKELSYFNDEYIQTGAIAGVYTSFGDCMSQAVRNHLPLVIAEDKISLGKRKLLKAVRELFPSFTVMYEHNRGFKLYKDDTDPTDMVNTSQQFRSEKIRYSVSHPIYRGGALWNTVRAERANLMVAQAEYKKVFYDLSVEVARSYLNLIKAKSTLARRERMSITVDNVLHMSEEKMAAGLISEIEHLNVQSQQSQIQHDIEAAKESFELSIVDFKKIMHIEVAAFASTRAFDDAFIEQISAKLEREAEAVDAGNEKAQEAKIDELVKRAYENRPEFRIQKHKLESAEWLEKVAHGGWLPQVNLVAEIGRKAEAYTADDNHAPWDDEHRIGIEVQWNLGGSTSQYTYDKNRQGTGVEATDTSVAMDGYYDRINRGGVGVLDGLEQFSRTKEAEIARKEARLELELSEKDIVSEVKETYYNYNRSLIQIKSIFKKLAYRQKLVELAKHRSEINEIQISEFIQAEMDLMQENEKLYQTMTDYFLAKIALNKAIGVKDFLPLEDI